MSDHDLAPSGGVAPIPADPRSRAGGVLALLLLLTSVCAPLHGQEPDDEPWFQIANEFFASDAVYPQERGELQLTLWPELVSLPDASVADVGLAVEYGVTDRWQVEIEWSPWVRIAPDEADARVGVGALELGARRAIMALGGGAFHLSLGLELGIPVGSVDEGFSDGLLELEPSVVLARDVDLGAPAQLFAEASVGFVERVRDPSDPVDAEPEAHEASLTIGGAVALGVPRLVLEVGGSTTRWNNGGDERDLRIAPGVVLVLADGWELGLGSSFGLIEESRDSTRLTAFLIREF